MKKLILFICFYIFSITAHAQTWFAPDDQWTFHLTGGFAGFNEYLKTKVEKDTVVENQSCKKIIFEGQNLTLTPRFVYEQDNRVYTYRYGANAWKVIYDFNLVVGDTIHIYKYAGYEVPFKVVLIDEVTIGNTSVKRQQIERIPNAPNQTAQTYDILEGIGNIGQYNNPDPQCSFLFTDEVPFCNSFVDGFDLRFICFSSNNLGYAPYSGCTVSALAPDPSVAVTVQVIPNPATDFLQVRTTAGNTITALHIFDVQGTEILNYGQLNCVSFDMHIGHLPTGMYMLVADTKDGRSTQLVITN